MARTRVLCDMRQDLVMDDHGNHKSEQKTRLVDCGDHDFPTRRRIPRSVYKQKKLEDEFANLRITGPAFKKQQGDGKPRRQRQKQRKNKKNQKEEEPDEDYEDCKSDLEEESATATLTGININVRNFTPEEREAYQKRVEESEGFDAGKYPFEVILSNPISEISLEKPTESTGYSTKAAKKALRGYNRKKRTKYKFVKLIRVCIGFFTGAMYYVTFQAKQDGMTPSPPRNFQALVRRFMGMHIDFCREEKKLKLIEAPGELDMAGAGACSSF